VNRSASNQSPEKRQKPPLRFLEHGGVFAYHKALTVFRSNDGNPERRSNPKRNIYGHRAGWPTTGTTDQIFKGRKVVLFGVAGAFTPVCGKHHLPDFLENLDQFKAQGVDEIAVTGVNVFSSWRHGQKAPEPMARLAFSPTATAISRARSGFRSISPRAGSCDDCRRWRGTKAQPRSGAGQGRNVKRETLLKQL
jgi:hypothetical protein